MTHLMSSIKLEINASGVSGNQTGTNATMVSSTPQNLTSTTMATTAECGKGSVNMSLRMTIALAVVLQLVFKLM